MKTFLPFKCWHPVLLLAVFTIGSCSIAGTDGQRAEAGTTPDQPTAGWFGGYFDVTLPPRPELRDAAAGKATMVLAFITADPEEPCAPSWGGTYSLEEAGNKLHLDAQIRQFRADGNDIAVSFGGQRGQDLSMACHDAAALADAYGTVISRYGLDVLDLDVEGSSAEPSAMRLRAEAASRLQAGRPNGQPLQVWLTLPVTRNGLDSDGKNSVEAMLAAGVDVAGINIMTMNFGPLENGVSMLAASRQAAEATHQTLQQLYSRAGMPADSAQTWRRIGLTPMIGDNDVRGNTFTLDDAAGLNSFAVEHGVGRLSLWSINRDTGCTLQEEWQRPSSHCSGIDQDTGDFANELSRGFTDSG